MYVGNLEIYITCTYMLYIEKMLYYVLKVSFL